LHHRVLIKLHLRREFLLIVIIWVSIFSILLIVWLIITCHHLLLSINWRQVIIWDLRLLLLRLLIVEFRYFLLRFLFNMRFWYFMIFLNVFCCLLTFGLVRFLNILLWFDLILFWLILFRLDSFRLYWDLAFSSWGWW
jgi:hypothetical protein